MYRKQGYITKYALHVFEKLKREIEISTIYNKSKFSTIPVSGWHTQVFGNTQNI